MSVSEISQEDRDYICYLRGFAIVSIVFGHVGGYWALPPFSSYLHSCGSTFFFFLSGAVLYHSFRRSGSVPAFYLKRYTALLLPYYLICIVSLLVYLFTHGYLPAWDTTSLMLWLSITPPEEIMPFPLGQLWFLFTYVMLILLCPLYIYLYEEKRNLFVFLLLLFAALSIVKYLDVVKNPLLLRPYKYAFFSTFFMSGIFCFSNKEKRLKPVLWTVLSLALISLSILGLHKMSVPDLTKYFQRRDIIAVMATMLLVSSAVLFKPRGYKLLSAPPFLPSILKFFHRHTFSVYLLHTFSIYLAENQLGLVNPARKDALYGIVKFVVVLLLTSFLAVPFSTLSKKMGDLITSSLNRTRTRNAGADC